MEQSILALIAFTFTASMTPGPNNIMLLSSGVHFGFRRSIPHMLGVSLGFPAMLTILGLGFGATIVTIPTVRDVISAIGIPYLFWLAWKIAVAPVDRGLLAEPVGPAAFGSSDKPVPRPMSFISASAFQWINAKAWVMAIGMLAVYAPKGVGIMTGIAIIVTINIAMTILSSITWTAFGSSLASLLNSPTRLRSFNLMMAVLLVATLIGPLIDLWQRYL